MWWVRAKMSTPGWTHLDAQVWVVQQESGGPWRVAHWCPNRLYRCSTCSCKRFRSSYAPEGNSLVRHHDAMLCWLVLNWQHLSGGVRQAEVRICNT